MKNSIVFIIMFAGMYGAHDVQEKKSEFIIPKDSAPKVIKKDLSYKQTKEQILQRSADFLTYDNDVRMKTAELEKKILELLEKGLDDNFKNAKNSDLKRVLAEIEHLNTTYKKFMLEVVEKLDSLEHVMCKIST